MRKCPRCGRHKQGEITKISTTNEWKWNCLYCDIRFNDRGQIMGEKKMHFEHCPVPVANLAEGQEQPPCECTRPATYHGFTWEEEDVEQLDMAIADVKESSGAVALPGLEYIRNMVAVRVGRGPKPLGWDITQEES